MSQLTNVNRSQLLAAATAITAMGFLTVSPPARAHPMLPLAPACNQYVFNGDFTFRNDRSGPISFNSTGPVASGTVRAGTDSGTVTGTIQGRNVDFTITWGGQTVYAPFKYTGTVGDDALIHDGVVDDAIYWHSTSPLGCQNLSEPVTEVPNQRVIPPVVAPMTTGTPSPADVTEVPNQRRVIPPFAPAATPTP
jgi:hypothetical protein